MLLLLLLYACLVYLKVCVDTYPFLLFDSKNSQSTATLYVKVQQSPLYTALHSALRLVCCKPASFVSGEWQSERLSLQHWQCNSQQLADLSLFCAPPSILVYLFVCLCVCCHAACLQKNIVVHNLTVETPAVVQNFMSSFLLWLLRALMVLLVVKSCFLEGHWAR